MGFLLDDFIFTIKLFLPLKKKKTQFGFGLGFFCQNPCTLSILHQSYVGFATIDFDFVHDPAAAAQCAEIQSSRDFSYRTQ